MSTIRTSLPFPTEPWEAAKNQFLQNLTEEERKRFKDATLENLFYDASAEQQSHARGSRAWALQQKITPLVEGIDDYGRALDVYSNAWSLVLCPLWGSIRVVLHIAREAGKFQEKLVDMFAQIGDALPRFRIYQVLFRNHERRLVALSGAFLEILRFCNCGKEFFLRAKNSRFPLTVLCKAIWKPFRQEFDNYMTEFDKYQKRVEKEAKIAHMIESAQVREIELANQALQMRNEKLKLRDQILSALPCVDYRSKHRKLSDLRHPGTNNWLQCSRQFLDWSCSALSDCLCCYGIPGSGKSVLAASLIDLLNLSDKPETTVCYYYCDYADSPSLDPNHLIATLIRQVLVHLPLDHFDQAFSYPYSASDPIPPLSVSCQFLSRVLGNFKTVFLILDGIDELTQGSQTVLLRLVDEWVRYDTTTIKVFITSRTEEAQIRDSLGAYSSIDLREDQSPADVKLFVQQTVETAASKGNALLKDPTLQQEVVKALVDGANGMLLWVRFQLFDISEALTEESLRKTLRHLPKDIDETYSRIVEKIATSPGGELKIEMMKKIFRWVVCARRPLKIGELEEAVGLEKTDEYLHSERMALNSGEKLISACGNLLVYHRVDQTVALAHHSVQQFLCARAMKSCNPLVNSLRFDLIEADISIGEICLAYLSFSDFETQLTKVAAPIPLARKDAERVIWDQVPFGSSVRWITSRWARPIFKRQECGYPLVLAFPNLANPDATLTTKYRLLEYVIDNWAFHSACFTASMTCWQRFKLVALRKQLFFEFRPWNQVPIRPNIAFKFGKYPWPHIYCWAIENGIQSALRMSVEGQWNLKQYLEDREGFGFAGTGSLFLKTILNFAQPPHIPITFWRGELFYELAIRQSNAQVAFACREILAHSSSGDKSPMYSFLESGIRVAWEKRDYMALSTLIIFAFRNAKLRSHLFMLARSSHHWQNIIFAWFTLEDQSESSSLKKLDTNSYKLVVFSLFRALPLVASWIRRHQMTGCRIMADVNEILLGLTLSTLDGYSDIIWTLVDYHNRCLTEAVAIPPSRKNLEQPDIDPGSFSDIEHVFGKSPIQIAFRSLQRPQRLDQSYSTLYCALLSRCRSNFSAGKMEERGVHCLRWAVKQQMPNVVSALMKHYANWLQDNQDVALDILKTAITESTPCLEQMLFRYQWPLFVVRSILDDEVAMRTIDGRCKARLLEM